MGRRHAMTRSVHAVGRKDPETLPRVRRSDRRELYRVTGFNRVSIGVQIVNAVEGGSSVWGNGSGSVRVAICQTCLTSGDTILA